MKGKINISGWVLISHDANDPCNHYAKFEIHPASGWFYKNLQVGDVLIGLYWWAKVLIRANNEIMRRNARDHMEIA